MLLGVDHDVPSIGQPTKTFFALRPPASLAKQFYGKAGKLCSQVELAGAQRPASVLHVTMLLVAEYNGRLPRELLEEIDRALSKIRHAPVVVMFNRAGSFKSRKPEAPFVLDGHEAAGLYALRLAIITALQVRDIIGAPPRRYSPHMTLAYSYRRAPRIAVDPFMWEAREFQLIESWQGKTKYVELGRWALNHHV